MKPLSGVPQRMTRSGIRVLMEIASRLPDVIHLEVGEPDFATPEHIVDGAFEAVSAGFTKYTANAGLLSLRQAIVEKLARVNQLQRDVRHVIVTSGAVCALGTSVLAVAEAGDEVLIPDPGWPNYESMVLLAHAVPVRYPLDRAQAFMPDLDDLARRVTPRTKALLINSPSNPAGAVFTKEMVEELAAFAERHDLYLISDEVYEELVFEGEHVSPARYDRDGRVISIFGASKTYAMTGWRLGYAVAPEPIAALLEKLVEPLISCASVISQKAAETALRGPQACVETFRRSYQRRRDLVVSLLEPDGLLATVPRGAFYALVDIGTSGMDSDTFARALLEESRVAVAPGATFGPQARQYVRISFATQEQALVEGLTRLKAFLAKRQGGRA
ncbi:MAG: pyridoxal phosphate-dependent aminotransferase [Deltaproteobacteria bacterium]|nr:pyridoxal phosphate-dependent aminotransferase [Deltaproteobacteria bacterium]